MLSVGNWTGPCVAGGEVRNVATCSRDQHVRVCTDQPSFMTSARIARCPQVIECPCHTFVADSLNLGPAAQFLTLCLLVSIRGGNPWCLKSACLWPGVSQTVVSFRADITVPLTHKLWPSLPIQSLRP